MNTLLGKGAADETHPLHLGMIGMHGTAYANKAVIHCDLIMAIGARWDDRVTGKVDEFCTDAKKIHVDIDPAEFNKVIRPDVCAASATRASCSRTCCRWSSRTTRAPGSKQCEDWRRQYPLKYPKRGGLRAQHVLDRLHAVTEGRAVITADVGQHQMWAAQFCKTTREPALDHERRRRHDGLRLSRGDRREVRAARGGGLGRRRRRRLPDDDVPSSRRRRSTRSRRSCLIINNNYLGMVRQWQELFYENRLSGVDLEGNPDFVKLAEAYGIKALRIRGPATSIASCKEARAYKNGPVVVVAEVMKEDNVFPMIPAGAPVAHMIIEPPKHRLEKPVAAPERARLGVRARSRTRDDVHTISLVVNNKPGVLVRVALVFSRRGYNIESLVVSPDRATATSRA